MLRVHRMLQSIGDIQRKDWRVNFREGMTAREIIHGHKLPDWEVDDVVCLVNGVEVDDLGRLLEDGDDLAFVPRVGIATAASYVFAAAVSTYVRAGVNWVFAELDRLLVPQPEEEQRRGEESSATFAWNGISTNFGPGSPVMVPVGRIRLGGQVIASSVIEDSTIYQNIGRPHFGEIMRIHICYGEGPIRTIGGLDLGACGQADDLGGGRYLSTIQSLPAGLKINGNEVAELDPDVVGHVRTGTNGQTPMSNGLEDKTTIYQVNEALLYNSDYIYVTADEIDRAWLLLRFPGGLYRVDGSDFKPFEVKLEVSYRKYGTNDPFVNPTEWKILRAKGERSGLTYSHQVKFPEAGQYDVKIVRKTEDDSETSLDTVSTSVLASVTEVLESYLSYRHRAGLGLEIRGTERFSGTLNNVTVPVDGILVTTWDETNGLQRGRWIEDNPTRDELGRYPSWIMGTIIEHERFGFRKLDVREDDIDWESLKEMADYGAELVRAGPFFEPRFLFDYVFDRRQSAWENLLTVCRTCRAVPLRYGSKITFRQDKPKDVSMVFPDSIINSIEVTYLNTRRAPSIINVQILNEDRDYERDSIPVERAEAGLEDFPDIDNVGERATSLSLYGVMRESQARREAIFLHRSLAMRKMKISMNVPIQHLGVEVMDRIQVQSLLPRWFATLDNTTGAINEGFSVGMRTIASVTNGAAIAVDQQIALLNGEAFAVAFQDINDDYQVRQIDMTAGIYKAGTILPLVGAPISVGEDVAVAFGVIDEGWKDFTVSSITLNAEEMTADIDAVLYDERVYDIPNDQTEGPNLIGGVDDTESSESSLVADIDPRDALKPVANLPIVTDIHVSTSADGKDALISWDAPTGYRRARFRVHARRVVAGAGSDWELIAQTEEANARLEGIEVGASYQFAVTCEDRAAGQWQMPELGGSVVWVAEEWSAVTPVAAQGLEALPANDGIELRCAEAFAGSVDVYEWRAGYDWLSGRVVGRTRVPFLWTVPVVGTENYHVRVRGKNGLFGPASTVSVVGEHQFGTGEAASLSDAVLPGGTSGTHSGTEWDSGGFIKLSAGKVHGSYVMPELDATTSERRFWSLLTGTRITDGRSLPSAASGSAEAAWRATGGREPSRSMPGIEFGTTIADWDGVEVGDLAGFALGSPGVLGEFWRVLVEARFHDGTSWGSWSKFAPHWRKAQKMEARVSMIRASVDIDIEIHGLEASVSDPL